MAPPDLVAEEVQGIDSCVDRWTTDSCTLGGDFGAFSGPDIEDVEHLDFQQSTETIDGRTAQLTTARLQIVPAASLFQSSVYFEVVDSERPGVSLKVYAHCSREAEQDETLMLFRSITFPDAPPE